MPLLIFLYLYDNKKHIHSLFFYLITKNEPRHDKTNKVTVCPAKTQISLGIRLVWSVFAVRIKKAWVLSYPLSARRRLIRLGGCPGWSESSLSAQSLCWFQNKGLSQSQQEKQYTWFKREWSLSAPSMLRAGYITQLRKICINIASEMSKVQNMPPIYVCPQR